MPRRPAAAAPIRPARVAPVQRPARPPGPPPPATRPAPPLAMPQRPPTGLPGAPGQAMGIPGGYQPQPPAEPGFGMGPQSMANLIGIKAPRQSNPNPLIALLLGGLKR